MHSNHDRRRFLRGLLGLGAGAMLFSRCSDGGYTPEQIAEMARGYDADLRCDDATGLWPAEAQTRVTNEYVNHSAQPPKFCFRCTYFVPPGTSGTCGSCKTVKGAINPLGGCKSWTELKA